jgi:hypothetical protein
MEIPNSAGAYCELDGRESMDIETKAESWYLGKHFPTSWGYGCGWRIRRPAIVGMLISRRRIRISTGHIRFVRAQMLAGVPARRLP